MGVPALFRWLSKKYPKIVRPVVEEEAAKVEDEDGKEIEIPIDISSPNPNSVEFDNLYLDMNGIVHPCTHPEGKPAPETEEAMMVEIFNYTERVVNMVRPRKLLFMAIDGVAPRAKMNQQRSRRFRSALEAKEKEDTVNHGIAIFEAMGKTVSAETRASATTWDSNAITPGTPFMDLLSASLRYWVVHKLNTDRGWKNLQVIISDASVPGEGEHKIMDFIRRQRVYPQHNPNTQHVMYGLDADLIMLSLATHEPNFRVLREDVFQDRLTGCRICGQEGHYAAQCSGIPKISEQKQTPPKKPFIFLDVTILREYLEIELDIPNIPFSFDLERAIDDWVLMIFFVGNDFLPHLPSLEIREGAIDVLLKIWKNELPRMGGYLTNHGNLDLSRAQIILEGLAHREDEIFRKRREAEERQQQNAKRRKFEEAARTTGQVQPTMELPSPIPLPASDPKSLHPSLPMRPTFDSFAAPSPSPSIENHFQEGSKALSGSNHDIVANRSAIRMANMTAAEVLKAELAGLTPLKPKNYYSSTSASISITPDASSPVTTFDHPSPSIAAPADVEGDIPGLEMISEPITSVTSRDREMSSEDRDDHVPSDSGSVAMEDDSVIRGVKRKLDEVESTDQSGIMTPLEEEEPDKVEETIAPKKRIINADGTIDQEDNVRLWEPGYRERYYQEKFGAEDNDIEFRQKVAKSYIEGLAWVLQYYYQGTPSWKWYYPYHYAPFAADFTDVADMDIHFVLGQPFKPVEQLMGVFPATSRKHIPEVLHHFMTDENSPIIDFYPSEFEIDMNGKKMSWQGVALLPFIDEERLLSAITPLYEKFTEDETRRNKWGSNALFVSGDHPLYAFLESLYIKRKSNDPLPLDPKLSKGIAGSVLPDPQCIPRATFYCPLDPKSIPDVDPPLVDIYDDQSLSTLFYYPKQINPHRSMLLNGLRRQRKVLTPSDQELVRRGGARRNNDAPQGWGTHSMHRELGRTSSYQDLSRFGNTDNGGYHNGRDDYRSPRPQYEMYGYGYPSSNGPPGRANAYAGYGSTYGHHDNFDPRSRGSGFSQGNLSNYPNNGYNSQYRNPGRNGRG